MTDVQVQFPEWKAETVALSPGNVTVVWVSGDGKKIVVTYRPSESH